MVSFSQIIAGIDSVVSANTERSDFEFIEIPANDNSIKASGFVKDNQIYIINERFDSKRIIWLTRYYFNNSKLICVIEEEHAYKNQNDTLNAYRLTEKLFEGKYYFYNNELIDSKTDGKKQVPGDITLLSQSKEGVLLHRAEECMDLLNKQISKEEDVNISKKNTCCYAAQFTPISFIKYFSRNQGNNSVLNVTVNKGTDTVLNVITMIDNFPENWVKETDIDTLISILSSKERCSCFLNPLSSKIPTDDYAETGGYAAVFIQSFMKNQKIELGLYACPKTDEILNSELINWWTAEKEKNAGGYKIDIDKIKSIAPKGWIVTGNSTNTVLLTKPDSARICNFINTDAMLNDNYEEFIKTKIIGKIQYQLKYTFEKALTDDEIKSANNTNDSVYGIIKKLPDKYNIAHLSRKYDDFIPHNEKDKQNIEKFKSEKDQIMKLYKKLPDFNTKKHSVYISENMPWYGSFCSKETEAKVYKLKNDIKEILTD